MPTVEYLNYEVVDDNGWDIYDDNIFEEAAEQGLDDEDYGTLEVNEGEYILEAAEAQGYDWPFSCRAGACANCAAIIVDGEINMDMQQILSTRKSTRKRRPDLYRVGRDRRGQDRLQRETPRLPAEPRHLSVLWPPGHCNHFCRRHP